MNLYQLQQEAAEYAMSYAKMYEVTDQNTLYAIYTSHLAHLLTK